MFFGSCVNKTPEPDTEPRFRPILMARAQFEDAVSGQPPRALHVPGKIFVTNRYLFINEQYQGIHVFDNADPARPVALRFLRIPGNIDLSVYGHLLYADSGPDLVVLDISNPASVRVAGRTRNALPELQPPFRNVRLAPEFQPANRPANSVVVGWEKR
ncbi:hypothetical protein GCM10023185_26370 [Hymenobacter saemangeumensis]|uniref:YncE family protein n=1 Tax=Hymenobacter saemangeumensis TaxID=1084522 RepID=A0ABP8IIQ8_9BACT